MTTRPILHLATIWSPARDGLPFSYTIRLTNQGTSPLAGFKLGVSGPARIDAAARVEGAVLERRLSNYALLAPPDGYLLAPGATWEIVVRELSHGLRHWTDGANAAYVILSDGQTLPVVTTPTHSTAANAPLLKGAARFPMPATSPVPVSIIPWPREVAVSGARPVPAGLTLVAEGTEASAAATAFTKLVADLFPLEALVRPAAEGGTTVTLRRAAGLGDEAYEITFGAPELMVSAATRTGFLYGLVTLGQILRGARQHPANLVFPDTGTITDAPGFVWRGTHLDVARQFYSSAEVSHLLKIMAWNKMNRFHWHLSEDEAWRVEIDAYPELTRIAAWRGEGLALPPLLGSGPAPTGGYYTKAAIREIVALAGTLGIQVVPEIDIPGHCYALLEALPQLRDPKETGEYQSVQGFPNNCLNPAHEPVYEFLETVIDAVLELFPGGIFHLGADEVPMAAWSGSPLALDLLEKLAGPEMRKRHEGLVNTLGNHGEADAIGDSPTAILQAYFIQRIHAMIAARGAITGGWEEAAHGDAIDKTRSYLVGWRNVEVNAALAAAGYDIVVAPGQRYYLDMANGLSWAEPGAGWAGWSGPEETYAFESREGMGPEQLKHLLGVQSCIWSEPMADRAIFDRLVFPRLSAVAEAGWTLPEHKSWKRFSALVGLMPIMYGNWAD